MSVSVTVRRAGRDDVAALCSLRVASTAERRGSACDTEGFAARFADWYERESSRRAMWLAVSDGEPGGLPVGLPVGMISIAVFERMPQPGADAGRWGYIGNVFVLAAWRNQGIGGQLLAAALAYADEQGFARVVLSPSTRSVPFYQRAGFGPAGSLLLRPGIR